MNYRRIALPVTCIIAASVVVGCSSKEREEGRRKLAGYVASQLEAANSKAAAYDFDGANAVLGELRRYVNESPYADVPTYDKLTADIEAAWKAFDEEHLEYRKKARAGWKAIGGKLVSPESQPRPIAEQKPREELKRAKREPEQARVAPEAKAKEQAEVRELERVKRDAEQARVAAEAKAKQEAQAREERRRARLRTTQARKWYEGGTLHNKSALQWQVASPEDKLATCADFVTPMWTGKNFIQRIQNSINSVDDMKAYARELLECLDAATEKDADPEQNRRMYANQTVSEMGAACMMLMGWLK